MTVFGVDGGRRGRHVDLILARRGFFEVPQRFAHRIAERGKAACPENEEDYKKNQNDFAET